MNDESEFEFPAGTIVMQHHVTTAKKLAFETHVLWFTGPRTARATAYRWNAHGTDATLVEDGEVIALPDDSARHWFSPGMEENLNLDMVVNGFLLSLNPRQLNRGSQLSEWSRRSWFARPINAASIPRLVALDDATTTLEHRVRSYLDVNCAACHRPGGLSRGNFDARFLTPLANQGLVNGPLAAGDLDIAGAHVVTAGRPETSILLERLKRDDAMRMPPVNVNHEPQPIVPLLETWIRSLEKTASAK